MKTYLESSQQAHKTTKSSKTKHECPSIENILQNKQTQLCIAKAMSSSESTIQLGKKNRRKKFKKFKARVTTSTATTTSVSESSTLAKAIEWISFNFKKLPELMDLITSHRRQNMLWQTSSTRAKAKSSNPKMIFVNEKDIELVHANDNSPSSKTYQRVEALKKYYPKCPTEIDNNNLNKIIPSEDEIQIAQPEQSEKTDSSGTKYISLQGVGRISAVRLAFPGCAIEIKCYTLPAEQIQKLSDVSNSYQKNEGLIGKILGTLPVMLLSSIVGYSIGGGLLVGFLPALTTGIGAYIGSLFTPTSNSGPKKGAFIGTLTGIVTDILIKYLL